MAKPLSELLKKVSPEVKAAASAQAAEMLVEMTLAELRQQRGRTQVMLRNRWAFNNPTWRSWRNVTIFTFYNCVNMSRYWGQLELVARFPDGASANIHL
ncbi:MAG: hypothetical protein R3E89_15305 [Thiolinea sp.]